MKKNKKNKSKVLKIIIVVVVILLVIGFSISIILKDLIKKGITTGYYEVKNSYIEIRTSYYSKPVYYIRINRFTKKMKVTISFVCDYGLPECKSSSTTKKYRLTDDDINYVLEELNEDDADFEYIASTLVEKVEKNKINS